MDRPTSADDNAGSWRRLREWIEERASEPDQARWSVMACSILAELEKIGLIKYFRTETSVNHIVFSTLDRQELRDELRVTLELQPETQTVRITYGRSDLNGHTPLIDARVSAPSAVMVVLGALRRLWTEAKPGQPMPEPLR